MYTAKQRKDMQQQILATFTLLDPAGKNIDLWKKKFKEMNDKQFYTWMESFLNNPDENFYLYLEPYGKEPSLEDIRKAVEINGGECEEYVYSRDQLDSDGNPMRSLTKVPVFPIHIKRLQQIVSKKNNYSFSIKKRNSMTNQVTGEDKVARNSDIESYALAVQGADSTLKELMGPRADSTTSKVSMYRQIAEKGYARLDQMNDDITQKATLRLLDVFLTSAGFKTDLVGDGLVLTQSMKDLT